MENKESNKPSIWFFAEWVSIIGTFIVCFVFLFYQNQAQCERIDRLYEQSQVRSDRLYEMFYELVRDKK